MGEKMRVGIIGSGGWASRYGVALQNSTKAELVAVAGGSRAPAYAERFGLRLEESVESLCAAPDLDLVIVACPHGFHAQYSIAALDQGKHVLVEKPMATTVEDCDRMIEAAQRNRVKLMVAHSRRYFPLVRKAKELLDAGEIGPILMMRQTFCHDARGFGERPGHWMSDPQLSVGFFLGYGCHQLDMTLWLVGSRAKSVFAQFGNPWSESPIEKCGALFIRFENGAYTTLWELCSMPPELSAWPPFPEFHEVNEIVGEKGLMILRPYQRVMLRRDGGWETVLELSGEEADPVHSFLREETEDLIDSIVQDTTPPVTPEEGKHTVEVCLAAYESSRTGEAVHLT
ncbi:MAG TPA: Gfo/Idh/MocA family oxidoreductase [Armatimonadetes bacterium]|nr:Gfo/Idh/MocA family oxidoreductase [Armatimonadota bacterium]